MLATRRYVVIHPRGVCVPREMDWGVEAEALRVQPISPCVIVRDRVLLENRHHLRAGTDVTGIERLLRIDVECNDLPGAVYLVNNAVAQVQAGHRPEDRCISGVAP